MSCNRDIVAFNASFCPSILHQLLDNSLFLPPTSNTHPLLYHWHRADLQSLFRFFSRGSVQALTQCRFLSTALTASLLRPRTRNPTIVTDSRERGGGSLLQCGLPLWRLGPLNIYRTLRQNAAASSSVMKSCPTQIPHIHDQTGHHI